MLCTQIFDFVSGTQITLPAPPCQSGKDDDGDDFIDIVRPNEQARCLVEAHMQALSAARPE